MADLLPTPAQFRVLKALADGVYVGVNRGYLHTTTQRTLRACMAAGWIEDRSRYVAYPEWLTESGRAAVDGEQAP